MTCTKDAGLMANLDEKSRGELLTEARGLGLEKPERMTRVELRDAILQVTLSEDEQEEARGLFGVARSMLASVVETGLNMPDAAKMIRGENSVEVSNGNPSPVATVTLAEIYAAQGHRGRALRVLEEVLQDEPDHQEALRVKSQLQSSGAAPSQAPSAALAAEGGVAPQIAAFEKAASASSLSFASDQSREDITAPAPAVAVIETETTAYVPGDFVETIGESIETGKPPLVAEKSQEQDEAVAVNPEVPPTLEEAVKLPEVAEAAEAAEAVEAVEAAEVTVSSDESVGTVANSIFDPALVLAQSKAGLEIYWELPKTSLEECGVDLSEGHAALRLVAFSAAGSSPKRSDLTFVLSEFAADEKVNSGLADVGRMRLSEFPSPQSVRAAIGWETEDGFLPLSVGKTIEELGANRKMSALLGRAALSA